MPSEVAVIGGGVMGTSIAYHLAKRGTRVTLIERDQLAAQASGATAGGVRQNGRDPRELPLAIAAIKRGDQVVTGGGFIGKVVKVDDNYAEIELAPGMKVKALKSTIADIVGPGGSSAAND